MSGCHITVFVVNLSAFVQIIGLMYLGHRIHAANGSILGHIVLDISGRSAPLFLLLVTNRNVSNGASCIFYKNDNAVITKVAVV